MQSDDDTQGGSGDDALVSALLAGVGDAVVECAFVDGEPTVRRANEAFVDAFVDDETSPVGLELTSLVESPRDGPMPELRVHETPTKADVTRNAGGGWEPYSLRIVPVVASDPHRQVAAYSDEPLRSQYDEKLESLHEATRDLIQQNTREGVAHAAVDAAVNVLALPATSVHLYDDERDMLAPSATTEYLVDIVGDPPDLPLDDSLAGRVYTEEEPLVYDDPADHPEAYNPETPLESELILPLGDHGVMMSGSTAPGAFSDRLVWLATTLASNTEAALGRIEREEALAARERELVEKNERLEAFAGMVSHDLRNPLNVAAGRVAIVAEEYDSEHLEVADDALRRMEALIRDLLQLASRNSELQDLREVRIDDVAADAWSQVRTGEATLEWSGEIGTARANRSRLAALLENLFRNAIDHGGDTATVRIGPTETGFYLADNGPGVPADCREDVFEVGYSTRTDGTGMGLAIVEEIVESHGWEVDLSEADGGGARFDVHVDEG